MAGFAAFAAFAAAAPAYAQSNPFVPSSGASRADVERIVDERMKAIEARLTAASKATPKAGTPGVPGSAAVPGTPGAPGAAGVAPGVPGGPLAPGGIAPFTAPGGTMAMAPAGDPIDEARGSGVRFLGCINGVPKFVKASGERVAFTATQLSRAVKAGYLPACR